MLLLIFEVLIFFKMLLFLLKKNKKLGKSPKKVLQDPDSKSIVGYKELSVFKSPTRVLKTDNLIRRGKRKQMIKNIL